MEIRIHTDGSTFPSNPGSIGVAFLAEVGGRVVLSWAYGGYGTSNAAEILAVGFALEVLRPTRRDDLIIYSDSMYAVRVLHGEWPPGVNRRIARAVQRILGPWNSALHLIRGHAGNRGNEAADLAAYQAGLLGSRVFETPVYIPEGLADGTVRTLEAIHVPRVLSGREPSKFEDRLRAFHQAVRRGKRVSTMSDKDLLSRLEKEARK